jgi:hypothetical protein
MLLLLEYAHDENSKRKIEGSQACQGLRLAGMQLSFARTRGPSLPSAGSRPMDANTADTTTFPVSRLRRQP